MWTFPGNPLNCSFRLKYSSNIFKNSGMEHLDSAGANPELPQHGGPRAPHKKRLTSREANNAQNNGDIYIYIWLDSLSKAVLMSLLITLQ